MRPRALALLLPLTIGDYLLWNWSVRGSHDILALASGMTLLPLAAISLGFIGALLLGLLARAVAKVSHLAVRTRRALPAPRTAAEAPASAAVLESAASTAGTSKPRSSARKLAA